MVAIFEKDKVTEESISSSEVQRGKLSNYKHIWKKKTQTVHKFF